MGAGLGVEWDVDAVRHERAGRRLDLPPGFSLAEPPHGSHAYDFAFESAERLGAGTLVWAPDPDQLEVAVVLEPEEPLATARRAFLVGMGALVDAVASVAPPDKALTLDWPDTVRFDGARLGGGRLGWPDGPEQVIPRFLVFGASLIVSKARMGDPGLTPESTSLDEEGFELGSDLAIVEAFARYLMRGFHAWRNDSFDAAVAGYRARLRGPGIGPDCALDGGGDLVSTEAGGRMELAPALRAPTWLDPLAGKMRL